jgi:hypothetical protein
MISKLLGLIIGTAYLIFFWVGGPFSVYVLFFESATMIRDWFFIMAVGATLVTILALWRLKHTQLETAAGAPGFSLLPMGIASTLLNLLIAIIAAFWT